MVTRHLVALLCGALIISLSSTALAQSKRAQAKQQFRLGVKLLDDPEGPQYAQAYEAFKEAYDLSGSVNLLGNLGLCAMKLERDGEALPAFQRYLKDGTGIGRRERKQTESDVEVLQARVATVVLSQLPRGAEILDERSPRNGVPIINRYGPFDDGRIELTIHSGRHRFTVLEAEKPIWTHSLVIAAGERVERAMVAPEPTAPAPVPESDFPLVPVVVSGVAGAFALGAVVTGSVALERQSAFQSANDGSSVAVAEQIRDEGTTLNVATDVLIGATVVGGGFATVLWLNWASDDEDDTARLQPHFGPSGVVLTGRF